MTVADQDRDPELTITDHLVRFSDQAPSGPALEMMRLSLLDWAACGMAGAREPEFDAFRKLHLDPDGAAQVLGGGRAVAPAAALVNGTLSHALDYDDTHFGHIGHPSVAVVPAVLALAAQQGSTLTELLEAALIGVEASIHVGLWLGREHYQIGYHQTATAGAFGATLATARLMRLDANQRQQALGLCASMASGLKSQFGTMAKPLNAGLAARTGVEATLWAAAGMTAARDGLGGPLGFSDTHHGQAVTSALKSLGRIWQFETISHKFHACCHGLHAMLEALDGVAADKADLVAVEIRTHPRWMTVCNQPAPTTGLAAKFSYAHTAAMALSGVPTDAIGSFSDGVANDPDLVALRSRVRVHADDALTEMQASVRVSLRDGQIIERFHDLAAPLDLSVRTEKLERKAAGLIGPQAAQALWQACQGDDLAAFLDQITAQERQFVRS